MGHCNLVQRARCDFLEVLGRKQLGSATEQGECSDLCGIRTLSLRPSKGRVRALIGCKEEGLKA